MTRQYPSVKLEVAKAARCTATLARTCSGPTTSMRRSGSFTGSVSSQRSGVHGSSPCQPRSASTSWSRARIGASMDASPGVRTPRSGSAASAAT